MLLLSCGSALRGQSAATVPASSGVYDRIESVSAWFPARGVFLGERPLSRREVQRVLARLTEAVQQATADRAARQAWARRELDVVRAALGEERGVRRGDRTVAGVSWRADLLSSDAQAVRIDSNGLGQIDAVSHPFTAGRHGWPAAHGSIITVAPTGVLGVSSSVALAMQPSASLSLAMRNGGWSAQRLLHRAYARGVFHNAAAQLGADEQRWGQSPFGALFLSGNTIPPPALSIGTDTAITLPWVLRLAGPLRMTTLLALLGNTQDPQGAKLAAWQATIQPWTRFELGVAVVAQQGGEGAPSATLLERFVDLIPVIDAIHPRNADLQISNKFAGGNLRLRFPELSGLDFYYELQIDDFDGRRLRSSLVDDAAHLLGVRLPLLVRDGQLIWRVEWHRTSLRLYEHAQFRSGYTYRSQILGSPLGPHAAAGYASVSWQAAPLDGVELAVADERRDPSQYEVQTSGPNDRGWKFIRLTDDPDSRRRRATLSFNRQLAVGGVRLTLGYNRAWRTGQVGREEWLGLVSLTSRRLSVF